MVELEKEEMPYYVYQCYKNVDWEKLKMLESDASTNLEFTEYQDKYVPEYNKSDKKKDFYYYEMEILFDNETITQPEELIDIQIEYKNKTFEEKLGNVNLTKFVEEPENITEKEYFSLMTGGMYNINAFPNKDGELHTPESGLKFEVYNDTVIKSIKILNNDSISVKDVVFKDATNGMDRKFDGELSSKKGDKGNICITLVDEEFKSKLCYSANMFLDIEFEAGDTTEHECIPVQFNTRLDPYEVYADEVDGVDILSFYTKYYEYNKE